MHFSESTDCVCMRNLVQLGSDICLATEQNSSAVLSRKSSELTWTCGFPGFAGVKAMKPKDSIPHQTDVPVVQHSLIYK